MKSKLLVAWSYLMNKRILSLVVISLLVLLSAIGVNMQATFGQSNAERLQGSWSATVTASTPPGLEPLTSLVTFIPGGGAIESRRLYVPASPLGQLLETSGHGEWIHTGNSRFEVSFVFLLQGASNNPLANGTNLGTDNIRLQLRLNQAGNRLAGTFVSNVKDPTGKVVFTASGNYEGTPIRVRP